MLLILKIKWLPILYLHLLLFNNVWLLQVKTYWCVLLFGKWPFSLFVVDLQTTLLYCVMTLTMALVGQVYRLAGGIFIDYFWSCKTKWNQKWQFILFCRTCWNSNSLILNYIFLIYKKMCYFRSYGNCRTLVPSSGRYFYRLLLVCWAFPALRSSIHLPVSFNFIAGCRLSYSDSALLLMVKRYLSPVLTIIMFS